MSRANPALRFSIRVNNDIPASQLVELAVTAERAGFEQLWVSHDLFLRSAPVLLAAVATATSTIDLGYGILNPYSAHPVELAMHAATLSELSGGRAMLGLGAGAARFLDWAGIDQPHPLARTRRALLATKALLAGEAPASVEGAGRWDPDARLDIALHKVPVYLGAMSPKMLGLAGELADGVLALLYPPEHYSEAMSQVASGAGLSQRNLETLDLPACVWVSVDEDPKRAVAPLAEKLAYFGPALAPYLLGRAGLSSDDFVPAADAIRAGRVEEAVGLISASMLRLGIAGTPSAVVERCTALLEAGARHISFGPPLGPDPLAAVRLLGKSVVPALRAWQEG